MDIETGVDEVSSREFLLFKIFAKKSSLFVQAFGVVYKVVRYKSKR